MKGLPNPFAGSVAESGGAWKDIARRGVEGALAISGARAFPFSDWDKKNEAFRDFISPETGKPTGVSYGEGTKVDKAAFDAAYPEFKEAERKRTEEQFANLDQQTVVLQLTNVARDAFRAELEKVPDKPSPEAQKIAYQGARDAFGATLSVLRAASPEVFAEWDKKVKLGDPKMPEKWTREQVYKGYTSIFTQFEDLVTHRVPPESKDEMGQRLDEYMASLTETQASELLADMGAEDTPWLKGYRQDMRDLKPYYDNQDESWKKFVPGYPSLSLEKFPTFYDYLDFIKVQYQEEGKAAGNVSNDPIVKNFTAVSEAKNAAFWLKNYRLDAIHAHWTDGVVHSGNARKEYHTMYGTWPRVAG